MVLKEKVGDPGVDTPRFPLARYISLMAIMLVNQMLVSYIFPFIGFFIVHIGAAEDKVTVGYSAGLVISMFFLGRGLSNVGWGMLADVYGRKAVLLVSLICSTVSVVGFGFSTTLFQMCAWRFLAGFLNGVLSTAKVLSFEMASTVEHQTRGAAFLSASWGAGLVVGPGIAGFLSEPCSSDSDLFGVFNAEHIFCAYPFSLPGIGITFVHILSFIGWLILPETSQHPRTIHFNCSRRCSPYSTLASSPETNTMEFTKVVQDLQPEATAVDEDGGSDVEGQPRAPPNIACSGKELSNCTDSENLCSPTEDDGESHKFVAATSSPSVASSDSLSNKAAPQSLKSRGRWWCQRRFLVLSFAQAIAIAGLVMASELASLWAILPVARGGPQWSEQTIGKSWVPLGIVLGVGQVFLIPKIVTYMGNEPCLKCALFCNMIAQCLLPWIALANPAQAPDAETSVDPTPCVMGLFLLVIASQQFCNQLICVPMMTLISSSVDGLFRARAVGFATSLQSVIMSVSPILAGCILSATVDHTGAPSANPIASFPGGTHPAFLTSSIILLIVLFLVTKLLPHEEINNEPGP